jgi:hypothetical protein
LRQTAYLAEVIGVVRTIRRPIRCPVETNDVPITPPTFSDKREGERVNASVVAQVQEAASE